LSRRKKGVGQTFGGNLRFQGGGARGAYRKLKPGGEEG